MITHVLDTSALLAHYLQEPGSGEVNALLGIGPAEIGISSITLAELHGRLSELVSDATDADRVFKLYTKTLTSALPFTNETAEVAILLRAATRPRLPLVDAMIAATAKQHGAILVHRDAHMAGIPATLLNQRLLPPRSSSAS